MTLGLIRKEDPHFYGDLFHCILIVETIFYLCYNGKKSTEAVI